MSKDMKKKIMEELKSIFWTSMYFFCWFGGLMIIKVLLLREYQIQFTGLTIVVIGALVVAKVVLLLQYIQIPLTKNQPAWVEVLVRTVLYLFGVIIVMALEKSFEARHEYGGILNAFRNLTEQPDIYHMWVNIICVSGALFFFNLWTVVKKNYGEGILWKIMQSPVPDTKNHE